MMKNIFYLLFLSLATITSSAQTELTDSNAEGKLLIENDRLIVLDFYATWCGPCKRMDPIMAELEREYEDEVDFYKIDVDKNRVDDALGITSMPTYLFIVNGSTLEKIEGSMSKTAMNNLILKHKNSIDNSSLVEIESVETYSVSEKHGDSDEYDDDTLNLIWSNSNDLNSLAWHTYLQHEDITSLLKALKIVERSIELEPTYYNLDTHAALLYKTGKYTSALKKAKSAVDLAKRDNLDYSTTNELIQKIIEEM